jgi:hypothetical protein
MRYKLVAIKKTKMEIKYQYEDRVCLFLDILGFSEHVNQTIEKSGEDNIKKIQEISELLISLPLKVTKFGSVFQERKITQFSDSIVISFKLIDQNAFIELLDEILQIILNFIVKGYLVRGGISYGKLVHNDNIVFGPAMISAYELESKIAIYPRIIFDKELVEQLAKNGSKSIKNLISNEVEASYFWKEDFDGKYYLNFLKASEIYMEPSKYYNWFLPKLREFIVKSLKNRSSQTVRAKFGWLKTKFNDQITDLTIKPNYPRIPRKIN